MPDQQQTEKPRAYFTITNCDTHKPLGLGGSLDRQRVIDILRAARPKPLILTEWYVTEWFGRGGENIGDEIVAQTTADEWLEATHA
jgi:hypothetical protein